MHAHTYTSKHTHTLTYTCTYAHRHTCTPPARPRTPTGACTSTCVHTHTWVQDHTGPHGCPDPPGAARPPCARRVCVSGGAHLGTPQGLLSLGEEPSPHRVTSLSLGTQTTALVPPLRTGELTVHGTWCLCPCGWGRDRTVGTPGNGSATVPTAQASKAVSLAERQFGAGTGHGTAVSLLTVIGQLPRDKSWWSRGCQTPKSNVPLTR